MRPIVLLTGLLLAVGLLLTPPAAGEEGQPSDDAARTPGTIRITGNPDGLGSVRLVRRFPALAFENPVWVGHAGDGSGRVFVAERDGLVLSFEGDEAADETRTFLDLRDEIVREHNEEGLLGLAFDPAFRSNRRFYAAYSRGEPRETAVVRYTTTGSRLYARARSGQDLLSIRQTGGTNNGGGLAFGPEGHLYVGVGDGGLEGDPRGHAQDLETWLGSILRIDPGTRQGYGVPSDNPLLRVRGARPEIWAYGFQDPRHLAFDDVTGDLWVADRGMELVEEIDVVVAGGNHGWNLREGRHVFHPGASLTPLVDPVLEIPRAEARRLTGGVVYRGKRMPQLHGAYVYADLETGNVWALRYDGNLVKENRLLARGHGVSAIGEDEEGELLLACTDGAIHGLVPGEDMADQVFPRHLSDTGLFTDVAAGVPHPSLIAYDVNVPLWSDGAGKSRWIMLPDLERVSVAEDGTLGFPDGTIFVKTFHLGDAGGEAGVRRLETRLFLKREGAWEAYTYVWNEAQEDAVLIDGRVTLGVATSNDPAAEYVDWTFPSRSDCMSCHTAAAGRVLGFRLEQLRAPPGSEGGGTLARLLAQDVFEGDVQAEGEAFPAWRRDGEPQDRERAVRAYLDVNCAMCHQPTGPGNANIDLRYATALEDTGLVDVRPGQWDLGVYGARLLLPGRPDRSLLYLRMQRTDELGMPTLAHNVPDDEALARVEAWIASLGR